MGAFTEAPRSFLSHIRVRITTIERTRYVRRNHRRWFGIAGVPNYFRQPFGPGWALVGDAAYDRDPITAQGISDAFIDAEALTTALDEGWSERRPLGDALASHQASRDRRVTPMHAFTCQLAKLEPPPPPMQRLFLALRGNQEATNELYSAITGSRPLPAFMNPENIDRIVARAELEAGGCERTGTHISRT